MMPPLGSCEPSTSPTDRDMAGRAKATGQRDARSSRAVQATLRAYDFFRSGHKESSLELASRPAVAVRLNDPIHASLLVLWRALLILDANTTGALLRDPRREPPRNNPLLADGRDEGTEYFKDYHMQAAYSAQPECLAALGDTELLRAYGPPLRVYHFERSEARRPGCTRCGASAEPRQRRLELSGRPSPRTRGHTQTRSLERTRLDSSLVCCPGALPGRRTEANAPKPDGPRGVRAHAA